MEYKGDECILVYLLWVVSKKSAKVCKVKFISLQLRRTPKGAGVSIFKSKSQWWRKSLNLSQRNIISSQGNANVFLGLSGLRSSQLTKVECKLQQCSLRSTFYSAYWAVSCSMRSITAGVLSLGEPRGRKPLVPSGPLGWRTTVTWEVEKVWGE